MRKFLLQFSYTQGKSGQSYCGVEGWHVVDCSRKFSLPSEKILEEETQKVWKLICQKYKNFEAPESLRSPKFRALSELHISETKVDWQPSQQ